VDVEECAAAMARSLDRFEALLDGREYLMGDDFSAADIAAFPFLKFALLREPDDDEPFHLILEERQLLAPGRHERLGAWIRRVNERPRV
jgi:glutathione S-transferase